MERINKIKKSHGSLRSNRLLFCIIIVVASYIYGLVSYKYNLFPYYPVQLFISNFYQSKESVQEYSKHYYSKKSFFDQNGALSEIVMIGDSHTMGAEWNELFPELSIANRGISGDTTEGILERMDSIYSTKAKKAFLMIGFNDIAKNVPLESTFRNYEKILLLLNQRGIKPYIQSTLFVSGRRSRHNKKISMLNAFLKKKSEENAFIFIDLNNDLSENGVLKKVYTNDDLHLNGKGYFIWKQSISQYMK